MGTLWLLLIVLVCPLMMMIMMRGMGGGAKKDAEHAKGTAPGTAQPADTQQARIAQLERQVAELRGVNLRKTDDDPARRP